MTKEISPSQSFATQIKAFFRNFSAHQRKLETEARDRQGSLDGLQLCFLEDDFPSFILDEHDDAANFCPELASHVLCESDAEVRLDFAASESFLQESSFLRMNTILALNNEW